MPYRPPAFIQVDVDGLWAVRACYGRREGKSYTHDPVWKQGTENFRRLFREYRIPAGFFLVGRDLELEWKRRRALALANDGHEIANHSYSHVIGLTKRPVGAILSEIQRAHDAIVEAGLPRPTGFRSPGYDLDTRIHRVLRRLGYEYDASLLPTRIGPALRLADAWLALKWQRGKRQFGRVAFGSAPRTPYFPSANRLRERLASFEQSRLMELPVSVLPPFGLPLTASSVFALGADRVIAALQKHRDLGRPLLVLLHGIDLVDCDRPVIFRYRRPRTGGFNLTASEKRNRLRPVLEYVCSEFEPSRANDWVKRYVR